LEIPEIIIGKFSSIINIGLFLMHALFLVQSYYLLKSAICTYIYNMFSLFYRYGVYPREPANMYLMAIHPLSDVYPCMEILVIFTELVYYYVIICYIHISKSKKRVNFKKLLISKKRIGIAKNY